MNRHENAIETQALTYSYPGQSQPAVREVDFHVRNGEIFGLLGPSGAGKSTLQRILTGQIRKGVQGEAILLGSPVTAWGRALYRAIGIGFELPNHYPQLTARENLRFFADLFGLKSPAIDEALDEVGLGLAADRRISAFSKGMKIRLNFVRATLHEPQVLFLDEPTSGLDPNTAGLVRQAILRRRAKGATVLIATHNMHDADYLSDRIGIVSDARLIEVGKTRLLKEKHGSRTVHALFDDGTERSYPLDSLGDDAGFLQDIKKKSIRTLHSQEASLDQVFKAVTGEELTIGGVS